MKSPLKYSKWPTILCFLLSFLIFGATFNSFRLSGGTITLFRVIVTISAIALYTIIGWRVSIHFFGTFLHRKVKNSVKTYELVPGNTYWLNGQTPAIYIGKLDFTGRYLFHIKGFNKRNNPLDAEDLTSDQVQEYISSFKEV